MLRLRIPLLATLALAGVAHAQTPAKLDDIQVSQRDGRVAILVKFSGQPRAASAKAEGDALVIDVDGVQLAPFTLDPPAGNLIGHVEAEPSGDGGSLITLSGAALGTPDAVVYRNAVLIEAVLVEPKMTAAASLLGGASKPAMAPKPVVDKPKAPDPAPNQPISLVPETAKPAAASTTPAATLIGLDRARCSAAKADLEKNSWAVEAMGDQAICLLGEARFAEAKTRLDQLAAFAPDDWRAAYGRAVLAGHDGKASEAEIAFGQAKELARDDHTRGLITAAAAAFAGKS